MASPADESKRLVCKFAITSIDVEEKEDGYVEFDGSITGDANDTDAVLLVDVEEVGQRQTSGWFSSSSIPVYRARRVDTTEFNRAVQAEVDRLEHVGGVLLYMHGYNVEPERIMNEMGLFEERTRAAYQKDGTLQTLCIPVIWPSNGNALLYLQDKLSAVPGSSQGLIHLVTTFRDLGSEDRRPDIPWSLLSHSMGNFLLRKVGELNEGNDKPLFREIFMVASDVSQDIFTAEPPTARRKGDAVLHPGRAIINMLYSGGKVHVLWTRRDVALFFRRWLNFFVRALGREGVDRDKLSEEFRGEDPKDDLVVERNCDEPSKADWMAHGYQFEPEVLEYYHSIIFGNK